jgi:phosphate transport system substrate-binding protein
VNIQFQILFACVSISLLGCGRSAQLREATNRNGLIVDGSETAYPIVSAMADDFSKEQPALNIVVNKSGSGSGIQRFVRNEIDVAAASRPMENQELRQIKSAGIRFLEVPFAADGVCIIVNKSNKWALQLSLSQLKESWQPQSLVADWSDLNKSWPHLKIDFFGPTDNHGTYDYFLEAMSPKSATLRDDVQSNQEYNAIVQSVADDPNAMGYVGLAFYENNRDKVDAVAIDFGKGPVEPSQSSVANGSYSTLSRPLLLYIRAQDYKNKGVVKAFVDYALSEKGSEDIAEAHYVKLSSDAMKAVKKRLAMGVTGSAFSAPTSFRLGNLIAAERQPK